jgi:hypothetical protein
MATKSRSKRSATLLRYTEEDLAPPSPAEAEDFADRFIKRNRAALNEALKAARASIERGEGVEVQSYSELVTAITKHRRRKAKRKK